MDWLELKIDTSHAGLDAVTEMLEQQGVTGVMIDDEADFQSFLENNRQYWDYVDDDLLAQKKGVSRVTFYLERNEDAYGTVAAVRMAMSALKKDHPEYAPLLLTMADVADEDWENNWKQYYQPLKIGSKLLVVPEWLHPENPEHRVEVLLDPGMIFGTGAHASTQMCMEELERAIQGGEEVLDLGSGSGILSITALLLGAEHATGVDIDPKAEDIARQNAAINQLGSDRFTALTGDVIGDKAMMEKLQKRYDIVLANIVADVIIPLAPAAAGFLTEDSIFICSGILNTRLSEVLAALEKAGMQILSTQQQDDWCRVTAALA